MPIPAITADTLARLDLRPVPLLHVPGSEHPVTAFTTAAGRGVAITTRTLPSGDTVHDLTSYGTTRPRTLARAVPADQLDGALRAVWV